jgi:hypothetical protein
VSDYGGVQNKTQRKQMGIGAINMHELVYRFPSFNQMFNIRRSAVVAPAIHRSRRP